MSYFFISAAHKSSGKTTVSIGIAAALTRRQRVVQTFKKGPDYIDPLWLAQASGRGCENLDFYTTPHEQITASFQQHMHGADVGLIEGNMGLYDGLGLDGSNSNAALAELLDAPVILVLNAQGMTRGIAPLILGYQAFCKNIRIEGIVLNRVGGSRHEGKLRAVIEHYTDAKVVGALSNSPTLEIKQRHLGLMPSNEAEQSEQIINALADAVEAEVNLDDVLAIAATGNTFTGESPTTIASLDPDLRIGIAMDDVFGFYYQADLKKFAECGVELVPFSPLTDQRLPDVDGLFFGGGFPETRLQILSENQPMLSAIRAFIDRGKPAYAECGGLMYLAQSIEWKNQLFPMVGIIKGDCKMHKKPQGRGYVQLEATSKHPWGIAAERLAAHEFHYSAIENLDPSVDFAFDVKRGAGVTGTKDGIVYKNLLASYTHQRNAGDNHWVENFVAFVRKLKHD